MRTGTKRVHESVDYVAHRNPARVRVNFLGGSSGSATTVNSSEDASTSEDTSPRGNNSPDTDRRLVSMLKGVTFTSQKERNGHGAAAGSPGSSGAGPARASLLAGMFASGTPSGAAGPSDSKRHQLSGGEKMLDRPKLGKKYLSEQMAVSITDFFTVSHSSGAGKYNCFSIKVSLGDGTSSGARSWFVYRRYSEFRTIHDVLVKHKLNSSGGIPPLPAKRRFGHFAKDFLEKRRSELEAWLRTILAFKGCMNIPAMRAFLTSNMNRPPQGHQSMGTNSTSSSIDEDVVRRRISSANTSLSSSTGESSSPAGTTMPMGASSGSYSYGSAAAWEATLLDFPAISRT